MKLQTSCIIIFNLIVLLTKAGCIQKTSNLDGPISMSLCLDANGSRQQKNLVYADDSLHPIVIPYPDWTSAQVLGHTVHILLSEVMNYNVTLFPRFTNNDWDFVNFAAGCADPNDEICSSANVSEPIVHFTLETWQAGADRGTDDCRTCKAHPSQHSRLHRR